MERELKRHLEARVNEDLKSKMVFLAGPRQVGKTYFATHLRPKGKYSYLNWDIEEQRTKILDREFPGSGLLILDELHKYRKWRGLLKSLFDLGHVEPKKRREILVTGSARLDWYRFGGDSLQGRYFFTRLLPLSFCELGARSDSDLESLMSYSGFPEPFLKQSEEFVRRWSREYQARLVREDIRDLERIEDLGSCELLMGRLPECVGSPVSLNALREDLQVAHLTVQKWIHVFERLFAVFLVPPMAGAKIRAVKKEKKLYFYNWTHVTDEAFRFENLIAVHLQKYACAAQDTEGRDVELRYFRDTDKREVDFVLLEGGKPFLFVEAKTSDVAPSSHLEYLVAKYPKVEAFQVYRRGKKDYLTPSGIRVCPARILLARLA